MKTLIIAEAGVNHNGKLSQAKKLIKEAKNAGADVVKFQYFKAENLAISDLKLAPYQKINSKFKNQFEMLKNLELSESDFIFLSEYSKKLGIKLINQGIELLNRNQSFKYLKLLLFLLTRGNEAL